MADMGLKCVAGHDGRGADGRLAELQTSRNRHWATEPWSLLCGDLAYTIPAADKIQDWTQQAFWCSGWLMLNEGDGSDQLVWNPYSLQQLLSFGPNDHSPSATSHGHGEYLTCLRERWNSASTYYQSSCESLKPKNNILQKQGVEVMQVISRCRANYEQSQWDEAAVLYGLFTAEEWTNLENIQISASAKQDDKFSMLRKQVVRLLENTGTQKLVLPLETWQCLHDALNAGAMRHNCHRMVSKFEYTRTKDNAPWDIDACKVSQTAGLDFPRFLWSGSSSNHVPLAKLHAEQLHPEQRQAYAENRLNKLLQEQIKPAFDMMLSQKFTEKLKKDLYTEAFSVEGDELHQLIDCVILNQHTLAVDDRHTDWDEEKNGDRFLFDSVYEQNEHILPCRMHDAEEKFGFYV